MMTAGYVVAPEICLRKQVPLRHFRQLHGPRARELFLLEPEPGGGVGRLGEGGGPPPRPRVGGWGPPPPPPPPPAPPPAA
ncbi:hypothetical protein ACFWPJ_11115, partial [Nocardia sp. NPDC058497]